MMPGTLRILETRQNLAKKKKGKMSLRKVNSYHLLPLTATHLTGASKYVITALLAK